MKQTTRLHDFFYAVVLFHTTGWKKSMRVREALIQPVMAAAFLFLKTSHHFAYITGAPDIHIASVLPFISITDADDMIARMMKRHASHA